MNTNESDDDKNGFFGGLIKDDGVQRAAAVAVVAVVVAMAFATARIRRE